MRRIELLDYARLVAALAVLAFHYLFSGITNGKVIHLTYTPLAEVAKYGYLGVEFFFLISGYVIYYSAQGKTAGEFATSRALRLYPAFWAAVLFTSFFAYFLGGPLMSVTVQQVLGNLTMVPNLLQVPFVDGVYWTLQLELMFYVMVGVLLLLGLGRHLERFVLWWPAFMLAAWLTGAANVPYLSGYFHFFAAGALFAVLRQRTSLSGFASLAVSLFLCAAGAVERAASAAKANGTEYSSILTATVIVLFFVFFLLMNTRLGLALRLPGSRLAGGLTYPIYLIHAHVGYMLLSRFGTDSTKWTVYPLVSAFVIASAYTIHRLVEMRGAQFWQSMFRRALGCPIDRLQQRITKTTVVASTYRHTGR